MKEKQKNELAEPFDASKGSMAGITPEYAFIMGAEWQIFRQTLMSGKPFTARCLPENRARFVKMAERHNRFVEDREIHLGSIEIWVGDTISQESPSTLCS